MSRRDEIMRSFDANAAYTEERVNSGINLNRKGTARIKVTDKDKNPVSGAKITAVLKKHEFKYGANIFMLDGLETDEKNEKYKKYFSEAFNMATLPFYWSDLEPERGKTRYEKDSPYIYRRPAPDSCIEFCEKHGIEPREHALAYENFFPGWLENKDVYTVKKELSRRFSEISERYAGKIPTIEVTNEMFWGKGKTFFYEDPEYVEWCFKEAEKYFPANELVINEWSGIWNESGRNRDWYYMQIERALGKGARINAVGMQFHMFYKKENEERETRSFYNPRHLYKIMDRYSEFNLPLQITEVTIPAYSQEAEDEQLQAELIEKLYSIWFSHPNVEQIIYWNLVDGYAAFAPQGDMTSGENYYYGGLLRFDMTPKPAYYTVKKLFEEKWHTEETFETNADGEAEFNGFFGEYDIEIDFGGSKTWRHISLMKKGYRDFTLEI
ncbi:MAG: endo-1,4-beta-xylanase [Clostridia bacterium]|nr:endo-1,4-beta-xylanase [Clostridia bacterium]